MACVRADGGRVGGGPRGCRRLRPRVLAGAAGGHRRARRCGRAGGGWRRSSPTGRAGSATGAPTRMRGVRGRRSPSNSASRWSTPAPSRRLMPGRRWAGRRGGGAGPGPGRDAVGRPAAAVPPDPARLDRGRAATGRDRPGAFHRPSAGAAARVAGVPAVGRLPAPRVGPADRAADRSARHPGAGGARPCGRRGGPGRAGTGPARGRRAVGAATGRPARTGGRVDRRR